MGSNSYTFNIAIFDDETLEDNELFRIYVEEPMRANGVMPVQADIIIMNDDGKLLSYVHKLYIRLFDCKNLQSYNQESTTTIMDSC